MMPTPMAELMGIHEFEFAFYVGEGVFDEYATAKQWEAYTYEDISYQSQSLNKFIHRLDNKVQPREKVTPASKEFSLLNISEEHLYSSFVPSLYDEDAFILRLKNPTKDVMQLRDFNFSKFHGFAKVNYIEDFCENNEYTIPPYDTLTLKLWI